jgi:hypothetical protein
MFVIVCLFITMMMFRSCVIAAALWLLPATSSVAPNATMVRDLKHGRGSSFFDKADLPDFISFADRSADSLGGATSSGGTEINVPGLAVFDCNNDGYEDILYLGTRGDSHRLFINQQGQGGDPFEFSEEAAARGLGGTEGGLSVVAFDFDNDGNIDVAISHFDFALRLYRNKGDCHFEDVTGTMAPAIGVWQALQGTAGIGGPLAAGDFDNDGDVDIFQTSIGKNGGSNYPVYPLSGVAMLWENMGTHFSPRFWNNGLLPFGVVFACSVSFEDFDEDGWEDVVISVCDDGAKRDTLFWKNVPGIDSTGRETRGFEDVGQDIGFGFYDNRGLSMAHCWGDFDGDTFFDVVMTDMGTSFLPQFPAYLGPTRLFQANWSKGVLNGYTDIAGGIGLDLAETGWGCALTDFDNDGWDDIILSGNYFWYGRVTNPGFVYKNVRRDKRGRGSSQRTASLEFSLGLENVNSYGLAVGDFDKDGFVDVAITSACVSGRNAANPADPTVSYGCVLPMPYKLYRNEGASAPEAGDTIRSYLDIELRGNVPDTNYYGIGSMATVGIPSLGYTKRDKIRVGSGWASTDAQYMHFGFPVPTEKDVVATVTIYWMGSMKKETWTNVAIGQRIVFTEGSGEVHNS